MDIQAAIIQGPSTIKEMPLVVLTLLLSLVSAVAACYISVYTHRSAAGLSPLRLTRIRLLLTSGGLGTLLAMCAMIATLFRAHYGWLLPSALLMLIGCGVVLTAAAASAGMLQPRFGAGPVPGGGSSQYAEGGPDRYPGLLLLVAPDGRIEQVNSIAGQLLGYETQELMGQCVGRLLYADYRATYEAGMEQAGQGVPQQLDVYLYHKEGGVVRLFLTLLPTMRRGRLVGIYMLGKHVVAGNESCWPNGQDEKLAALGNLAAGIAHEIRNPLTVVKGLIQFNRHRVGMQFHYDLLMEEILQIEAIISDFLMLSSETPELRERIDFGQLVKEAVESADDSGTWQLIDQSKDNTAWIHADEIKLVRSLRRLLVELQDIVQAGGRPVLLLGRDNGYVCLTFLCEGSGWEITSSPAFREGELYYDTKTSGTGLAYMVAYHIFTDHGASMQVCSSEAGEVIEIRMQAEWTPKSLAL
ncbi:histidine kinase dimerization/phospho-acceptor domain-containing protein [Paenibacillus daejeonensis]|uniref:histidine kinase dimerization/phospho-acceptor domain-containing protein n=1 Tax=Paenibacillus daejeonensis TaxID=135193 RepID=UPI00036CF914|nr:histidine kinase dimerization/phospho-acceptor domain-containing protein [Paenibacillus daejeonensis]